MIYYLMISFLLVSTQLSGMKPAEDAWIYINTIEKSKSKERILMGRFMKHMRSHKEEYAALKRHKRKIEDATFPLPAIPEKKEKSIDCTPEIIHKELYGGCATPVSDSLSSENNSESFWWIDFL